MTSPAGGLDRALLDRALLQAESVVAILRSDTAQHFRATVATLVACGIHLLEFSLTTPGALDAIAAIRSDLPGGVLLGAGTVVSIDLARQSIDSGADFLVTPSCSVPVIAEAAARGVPILAGAFTPTEIVTAWDAGATAVKLFPASVGGPAYLGALREPFPTIALVPTGGVNARNAAEYLRVGAVALGLGRSLIGDATEGGSQDALASRATELVAVARGGATGTASRSGTAS